MQYYYLFHYDQEMSIEKSKIPEKVPLPWILGTPKPRNTDTSLVWSLGNQAGTAR
jgi:hypothetical protein